MSEAEVIQPTRAPDAEVAAIMHDLSRMQTWQPCSPVGKRPAPARPWTWFNARAA